MRQRRAALAYVVLLSAVLAAACAVSLKQKAVLGLQVAEQSSGIAQDAERSVYASGVVKALTPAKHADIARIFSRIFQDERDAAQAMRAWKAGEPAPASVGALLADAGAAWAALQPLLADIGATNIITTIQDWVGKVVIIASTVNLGVPADVKAALAYKPVAAGGGD